MMDRLGEERREMRRKGRMGARREGTIGDEKKSSSKKERGNTEKDKGGRKMGRWWKGERENRYKER